MIKDSTWKFIKKFHRWHVKWNNEQRMIKIWAWLAQLNIKNIFHKLVCMCCSKCERQEKFMYFSLVEILQKTKLIKLYFYFVWLNIYIRKHPACASIPSVVKSKNMHEKKNIPRQAVWRFMHYPQHALTIHHSIARLSIALTFSHIHIHTSMCTIWMAL